MACLARKVPVDVLFMGRHLLLMTFCTLYSLRTPYLVTHVMGFVVTAMAVYTGYTLCKVNIRGLYLDFRL